MLLAVDLGSTSFKAAVFTSGLKRRGGGRVPLRYVYGAGNRVELDVTQAETALRGAIRAALAAAACPSSKLTAAAITSQAQTFCILDRRGEPKSRFISWQDERAAQACQLLKGRPGLAHFADHASFSAILSALQICQLRHLRDEQPGLVRPSDRVASLPAFFLSRIADEFCIDDNLAAMTGLYSLPGKSWWPEALAACGLQERQLPGVVPIGSVAGRTTARARAFGLPAGLPVVLAGNDQTAGAYGARIHQRRRLLLTLGTAHAAYACRARMPRTRPGLIRGPYPGRRWYAMRADGCGGNVVDWAKGLLACTESDDEFYSLAAQAAPGCRGLTFRPDVPTGNGRWDGLALHHTQADLARSVLESLADRLAAMAKTLGTGRERAGVLAAGGGSRQPLWISIIEQKLGFRVRAVDTDPALGAAMLAKESLVRGA